MEEVVLRLEGATYRHSVYAPLPLKPWRRIKGPGIFEINLTLQKGTILGLVGPNGAGKTTLLRVLAGILPIHRGRVYSRSEEIVLDRQQLRQSVGHMPEQVRWQGRKTVRQALLELGEMRHASEKRIDGILKLVGLSSRKDSALSELSQGMRQRLTLAVALLGSPKILLLDEPLNGLDPVGAAAFISLLKTLTEKGVSIVLSSHQVEGLAGIIDRLALMHRGHILAEGTLKEVAKGLHLDSKTEIKGTGQVPHFSNYEIQDEDVEIEIQDNHWTARLEQAQPHLLAKLINDGVEIAEWGIRQPNVVEMLCAATGQSIEDVGLEVASNAYVPLRTFGGEEE
ncbi:MAG: ABC transporter ATP-binding protein [Euryarchaeota archaeon]|jgi:ABC-type multidrug transport system ATPase subunit|nr:ABC transporter ATP-binding protein [Euryarchaeota archaeon]MBT6255403.1 ABC transporter ATP-binding protein [Euryarchaeota archaeon]